MSGFTGKKKSYLTLERELQKARAVLFLPTACTEEDVRGAFAKHVKLAHPDSLDQIRSSLAHIYSLEDFRKAKDILLKELESRDV